MEALKKLFRKCKMESSEEMSAELMTRALSAAMKAQEKTFLREMIGTTALFAFHYSWDPVDWLSTASLFGEIKTDEGEFRCLKTLRSGENPTATAPATVNAAFLKKSSSVWGDSSFQKKVCKEVDNGRKIVFTGYSSGAATAILLTVKMLEKYLVEGKSSISIRCITFGSPLVGDFIFGHALRRENWAHHFLHFVTLYDIVPRLMLAPRSSIQDFLPRLLPSLRQSPLPIPLATSEEASGIYLNVMKHVISVASFEECRLMTDTVPFHETLVKFIELSPYRPFGTYMFLREQGEPVEVKNPDAVLQLFSYFAEGIRPEDIFGKMVDAHKQYTKLVKNIRLSSHGAELTEQTRVLDELGLNRKARICLLAADEAEKRKRENQKHVEETKEKIMDRVNDLDEYTKLDETTDYYERFKSSEEEADFKANVARAELAGIWDEITEMLKKYDLPDDFEVQEEWIRLGTRYRNLVEPLDIANYYRHFKNEDTGPYMKKGRPRRYKFLQQWQVYQKQKSQQASADPNPWEEEGNSCKRAEEEERKALATDTN